MGDLCILSDTFEVHLERLERTVIVLRQHGLRMNARKCQFCRREVDFCVSTYTDGLSPDVQKIDAVTRIPPPSSATSKYFWEPHAGCKLVQFEMIRNLYLRKQYEH